MPIPSLSPSFPSRSATLPGNLVNQPQKPTCPTALSPVDGNVTVHKNVPSVHRKYIHYLLTRLTTTCHKLLLLNVTFVLSLCHIFLFYWNPWKCERRNVNGMRWSKTLVWNSGARFSYFCFFFTAERGRVKLNQCEQMKSDQRSWK